MDHKRFPPAPPEELDLVHEFADIERVVVTRKGVYGLGTRGAGWIKFVPIDEIDQRKR